MFLVPGKSFVSWVSVCLFIYSQVLNTADGDLLVDYSKNIINDEVMKLLVNLVLQRQRHCNQRIQFV